MCTKSHRAEGFKTQLNTLVIACITPATLRAVSNGFAVIYYVKFTPLRTNKSLQDKDPDRVVVVPMTLNGVLIVSVCSAL